MEPTLELTSRTDLLPAASVPLFWVVVIFALATLVWLAARWLTRKYEAKLPAYWRLLPRCVTAVFAAWAGYQLIGRLVEFGCRWPIWGAALMAGLAVECTAALYMRERNVIPKRLGLVLTTLRSLAIVLTAVLIMQPVYVRWKDRHIERRVEVLIDESGSMDFVDGLWTVSEKLAWGRAFGRVPGADNPLPSLPKLAGLQTRLLPWSSQSGPEGRVDDRDGKLAELLDSGLETARAVHAELEKAVKELAPGNNALKPQRDSMEAMARLVRDNLGPSLDASGKAVKRGEPPMLAKALDALKQFEAAAPGARLAADEVFWSSLDEAARASVDALTATTRVELARMLLTSPERKGGRVFLDQLASRYDVDLWRMGYTIQRIPRLKEEAVEWLPAAATPKASTNAVDSADATNAVETAEAGMPDEFFEPLKPAQPQTGVKITWNLEEAVAQAFRMTTDYTMALEALVKEVSSEMLAGVVIVSDGLHNGAASFDPIARRLGSLGVPVMGVTVGGSRKPFDIAVADVIAPESIFLGDNVRVHTTVRATNAKGKKLNVRLLFEGTNVVDQATVEVKSDDWKHDLRFRHQPENQGIVRYEVATDIHEGELFEDNNSWAVDVAVSDDRTNVLLIDHVPRWEFRYLRNLFFGRDKSVHLQYYLVRPDLITDTHHPAPLPPASAGRKFGDAEAGAFPDSREEWRKFDVIILGDLPPDVLTEEVLDDIRHCVDERGALLVMLSGPDHMPHDYPPTSLLHKMLPVTLDPSRLSFREPPDANGYTLAVSPAGQNHSIMRQSASFAENDAIWQQMPDLAWRIPLSALKSGAEVLAYAKPSGAIARRFDFSEAAEQLDAARLDQERRALIVASKFGRGKVLALMFDRTWRFRFRVGDTHHHRFWGQVMRWGVGEKLRAGDEFFRVGTDQVVYMPGAPVQIYGRVMNPDGSPAQGARLEASVTREDGVSLGKQRLNYREDSNGLYEAEFRGIDVPGRYTVRLARNEGRDVIETSFLVTPTRRPVELADVAANPADLARLARITGGRVVEPDQLDQLLEAFGEGRRTVRDKVERPLWDNPFLFILIVGLLTAEWILRKKGNLV